jgi:hypothetical protein
MLSVCSPGEEESRSFIQHELEQRRRDWDQYARSGQWDELSSETHCTCPEHCECVLRSVNVFMISFFVKRAELERMDLTDAERKELAETIESKMLSAIKVCFLGS